MKMMRGVGVLVMGMWGATLVWAGDAATQAAEKWEVAENNPIKQIYVGKTTAEGTELVLELGSMAFYSNQRLYGCVFVNGKIAQIKEYNNEDKYVRVVVKTPERDEELVVYCGVIKAPEKIDPHDHDALWKAFTSSGHKPFKAKAGTLPRWFVKNPIAEKRLENPGVTPHVEEKESKYPYLKPEERAAAAKAALDPLTGDKARFRAVWGLAISGYSRESAEALTVIATDPKHDNTMREYAVMGLTNFSSDMPAAERETVQAKLVEALRAEKEKAPLGLLRALVMDSGQADVVREVLGEKLNGHAMEIEVLGRMKAREQAIERLMALVKAAPGEETGDGWLRRWHLGAALIKQGDKRGVDLLMTCLMVKEPAGGPPAANLNEASRVASQRQARHNLFNYLATLFDEDFEYQTRGNWQPELDAAIEKMKAWWAANREKWNLEEATSMKVPVLEKGQAISKRQARVLAAKLATQMFAEKKFVGLDGKAVRKIEFRPEWFNEVHQKDGKWQLRMGRGRGVEASVTFDADGLNEQVIVDYGWR